MHPANRYWSSLQTLPVPANTRISSTREDEKTVVRLIKSRLSRSYASNNKTSASTNTSDRTVSRNQAWAKSGSRISRRTSSKRATKQQKTTADHSTRRRSQRHKVSRSSPPSSSALKTTLNEIKRQLQGDVTSSDTVFQTITPTEVKLTRSRFPWFDARITHQDPIIVLDYAKGLGVAGDPTLDRKTCHFAFHVDDDDTLSVQESFGDSPRRFHQAEELARHIVELLFEP